MGHLAEKKWVLTAAPLYSFMRNRCEAKTKDAHFCPDANISSFFFLKKIKFKMEKENMVHLETWYLTHSKCLAMIKIESAILLLFCTRFRIFDELVT